MRKVFIVFLTIMSIAVMAQKGLDGELRTVGLRL